jgi:hypothetical protein
MPHLLKESTLLLHNLCHDLEAFTAQQERQEPAEAAELRRVETWITSLATRSAGLKGWSSVTRPRATSVSSASSIAVTLATVCTNAGSSGGLEEEDEKSEYPSQDRNILRKRTRQMAEVRANSRPFHLHTNCIFLLVKS